MPTLYCCIGLLAAGLSMFLLGRAIGFGYSSSQMNPDVVLVYTKKLKRHGRIPDSGKISVLAGYHESKRLNIPLVLYGGITRSLYPAEALVYESFLRSTVEIDEMKLIVKPVGKDTQSVLENALLFFEATKYTSVLHVANAGHLWRIKATCQRLKRRNYGKTLQHAFMSSGIGDMQVFLMDVLFWNILEPIVPNWLRCLFQKLQRGGTSD